MPVYEYEHTQEACGLGHCFEVTQSMSSAKLATCPRCGGPVKRLISLVAISAPKTASALKNMGFTKLVRRDKGVYENVTATGKESRIWDASKPETMPDLKSKIRD
ncbi:MAG: transcriptional regulator [Deltaproteobacteria bacterium CG_4_10_14_3_um_filter_60_8]|nr:MAG: transcriptional regulator [Desulfobacterales bacterium CG2_30_60_27]PIP44067.1 MAG: transcriptional regulator [Deltaproteobacteria bacterium CG23_combo_of_CG06-09_8_20_14_all_60_8]PIY21315.1 MAG: transcriptional regulator [Deltaproteobacteria bacterium CG_4_10_14_3_um_filter_60_8]